MEIWPAYGGEISLQTNVLFQLVLADFLDFSLKLHLATQAVAISNLELATILN